MLQRESQNQLSLFFVFVGAAAGEDATKEGHCDASCKEVSET
jgi:hypothetical protein